MRKLPVQKKTGRVRSAERDKRTEFQARYWAFLFGNLQRAIDEIFRIVEYYENLESCQEAILVLENYTREFRALAEFFKMSWDYEKTHQRPQSVAWEVRKTNYSVPRMRNRNLTSPGLSEKSSPSYSGTNSPCPTIEEHKPIHQAPQNKPLVENVASSNEEKFEQLLKESNTMEEKDQSASLQKPKSFSLEDLKSSANITPLLIKCESAAQTEGLIEDNLTLQEYLLKYCKDIPSASREKSSESTQTNAPIIETTPTLEESKCEESVKQSDIQKENEIHLENPVQIPPPPLSQIIKPQDIQKSSTNATSQAKVATKPVIKANYSLRNQTITSNKKAVELKSSYNVSHSRQSRPQVRINSNSGKVSLATNQAIPKATVDKNHLGGRSKTMIELPKNQTSRFIMKSGGGELRKKKSIEDNTDSSSSTLKASTEILGSKGNLKNASGDNKKIIGKKTESSGNKVGSGDGEWRMVKTKRRTSWINNRFDQPSASASLPALALLNSEEVSDKEQLSNESNSKEKLTVKKVEKKEEKTKPKPSTSKAAVDQKREILKNKSAGPVLKQSMPKSKAMPSSSLTTIPNNKKMASVKAKVNSNVPRRAITAEKSKPLTNKQQNQVNHQTQKITRQKSDITGLKIKSLHKEYLRSGDKVNPMKKKKENCNDQKVDMNLQTSQILISETIDELYCSEVGQKRTLFINGGGGNLSSCDEVEERDLESDDDQKKLVEEQENLERQIRELENCDIDEIDTETDETDCEAILCELDDNESSNDTDSIKDPSFINENMTLEMRYAPILGEMSVHEREETLATLQTLLEREPGRAMKLHQKLSSPSRRRSIRETLKKYQAKHFKAHEKRTTIQKERAQKIQQLIQRVEQVKAAREQLTEQRRIRMEERLQRATENRENYLKNKVKKAHDEEEKLKEIAFIKNLEMQNKMLDFIESCKEQEVRLSSMELER